MVWQAVNVVSHQYKEDTDSRGGERAKVHLVWCWVQHFWHVSGSVLGVVEGVFLNSLIGETSI